MEGKLELTHTDYPGLRVIHVDAGRIDSAAAIQFKDQMRALTDELDYRAVLDLKDVKFIDSSGLGAIVASMKQMPKGIRLDLATLQPDVARVLRLTRMDKVFVIHEALDTAVVPNGI